VFCDVRRLSKWEKCLVLMRVILSLVEKLGRKSLTRSLFLTSLLLRTMGMSLRRLALPRVMSWQI
jgi:hypothetical protein